jgi:hypothetical protein
MDLALLTQRPLPQPPPVGRQLLLRFGESNHRKYSGERFFSVPTSTFLKESAWTEQPMSGSGDLDLYGYLDIRAALLCQLP